MEEAEFCPLEELRFGSRRNFQRPNLPVEASFWLPNPAPESWTFGSGGEFRLPKVPPNMHEFRLWKGLSAAEGAAESG